MPYDVLLPNITGARPEDQIQQIKSYLYQLAEQLNWALNTIEKGAGVIQDTSQDAQLYPVPKFNQIRTLNVLFEDDEIGWVEGSYLDDMFPGADTSKVMGYALFMAVIKNTSGATNVYVPVLCSRINDRIFGAQSVSLLSDDGNVREYTLRMDYTGNKLLLTKAEYITHRGGEAHGDVVTMGSSGSPDRQMVTALYALM